MIFSEEIQKNCSNLCKYFEKIFAYSSSRLAHSIILYGLNAQLNYKFALELARILNCQKDKSPKCDCLNCQWISENKHPSVKTYSNLSNKTKSDESKLSITVAQISQLKEDLVVSSEYKRVYIICGEKENKDGELECLPLSQKVLGQETSNALLKSIEEPPKNTYFIFICKDKNDLLPTIISRSQSFYVHSAQEELEQIDGLDGVFRYYPVRDYSNAKEFIQKLQEWKINNELDFEQTIKYVQSYLQKLLKANIENLQLTNLITADIMKFEDAERKFKNNFKESLIWENLIYKIYKD